MKGFLIAVERNMKITEEQGIIVSWNSNESVYSWTSLYMDGTAIFDLPTWGGPFNPYNVTQTHSIFIKLLDSTFLGMPKVRAGSFFTLSIA